MAASNVETLLAPRDSLTNSFTVGAREVDFVTRFGLNWDALREIMGIMNPVRKTAGTKLVSYTASVTLEDGDVPEGAIIPYSKATVVASDHDDLALRKYAKAVTVEDVTKYGAVNAIQRTDEAFLNELQGVVMQDFYTTLTTNAYAMTGTYSTFQMAVAMAIGKVRDKFKKLHRNANEIVVFVNTLDAYQYLGAAQISLQSQFGIDYVQNFMGATTMILSSEITSGTVIAIPSDNIVNYYIDPSDGDIAQLGLNYTVQGETNLIGFHAEGNYNTALGASFALMGMKLWMEYADGVAIVTVDANPLKGVTVTPELGSTTVFDTLVSTIQSNVAVNGNEISGDLNFIAGGMAASGPLAGDGWFLALKWTNPDASATSLKVGLVPSEGTGLVEAISDLDRNGVFKIHDTDQQVVIESSATGHLTRQVYSLKKLNLLPAD